MMMMVYYKLFFLPMVMVYYKIIFSANDDDGLL